MRKYVDLFQDEFGFRVTPSLNSVIDFIAAAQHRFQETKQVPPKILQVKISERSFDCFTLRPEYLTQVQEKTSEVWSQLGLFKHKPKFRECAASGGLYPTLRI